MNDAQPQVQLVRSARRRRTYKWSLVDGQVQLEVPVGLGAADEARIISEVTRRARRRAWRTLPARATLTYSRPLES